MNAGYLLDAWGGGAAIQMVADVLTAVSFLSIILALILVAARREAAKYRRTLFIFAFFVLFAGFSRVVSLSPLSRFQAAWSLITATLSVLTAFTIVFNLPRYLRIPKIA
jgi:hypothetical protein